MKSKHVNLIARVHFITLALMHLPAAAVAQSGEWPYGTFPNGIQLDPKNLIYRINMSSDPANSTMVMESSDGGLILYSGHTETSSGAADGGITLMGSPIAMVLGESNVGSDASSFNIWQYSKWGDTSALPLFSVDGLTGNTTFTNSNVAINNGNLTIAGSPVLTQASAVSALSSSFLPANPSSIRGSGAALGNGGLVALGNGADSSAEGAVAIGNYSAANAADSVSIGSSNFAGVQASVAIGSNSMAMAGGSVVIGAGSFSWENAICGVAIAGGHVYQPYGVALTNGHAIGDFSFALGGAIAAGNASIALGGFDMLSGSPSNQSTNENSTTIGGVGNRADGFSSFATGFWTKASSYGSVALGSLNVGGGIAPNNWVESDPLFEVGNGSAPRQSVEPNASTRSNAITTLKNGQTTLTNKAWKANPNVEPTEDNSYGQALVVEGNTVLKGKVIIDAPQGDISMGIYGN